MTVQGTVNAAFILISLTMASAMAGWYLVQNNIVSLGAVLLPGLLGGLVLSLIMCFAQRTAIFLAPLYAVMEGTMLRGTPWRWRPNLGRVGAAGEGLAFQAVLVTFGIFFSLLLAYKFRLVRVGETLRRQPASWSPAWAWGSCTSPISRCGSSTWERSR